jgi:hypothetical protein
MFHHESNATTFSLLDAIDEADRDRLVALGRAARIVEEMTSRTTRRGSVQRWAAQGIRGIRLRTVTVGRTRYTTRRWLLEFFVVVDAARMQRHGGERGRG